jgi:hypothetical protein
MTFLECRPMSDPQLTAHCIYIPCECGRSYVGETGRPLSVRIGEHKFNLKNGLLDKSKSKLITLMKLKEQLEISQPLYPRLTGCRHVKLPNYPFGTKQRAAGTRSAPPA